MGLSAFDDYSSSSYCCSTMDQSLTKRLLELSSAPSQSSSRFAHTPDWADGLDTWAFTQYSMTKLDLSRRHLDFHDDIGLYLPRSEKPKSAPTCLKTLPINPKVTQTTLPPERIRHLLRKEKDLLYQSDSSPPVRSCPSPSLSLPPQFTSGLFVLFSDFSGTAVESRASSSIPQLVEQTVSDARAIVESRGVEESAGGTSHISVDPRCLFAESESNDDHQCAFTRHETRE